MLKTFIKMFADKGIELLVLQGSAGIGKTEAIKEGIGDVKHLMLSTHSTPLALHIACYEHRNECLILEDIDNLLKSPIAISELKQLTETRKVKTLSYHTTSHALSVPKSFKTSSNCLISCNKMQVRDKNMKALISRGLYITFKPSRQELLRKMEQILPLIDVVDLDIEERRKVLSFIKKNEPYSTSLNLRHLVKGLQMLAFSLREKGFDWRKCLSELLGIDEKLKEVLELMKSGKPVKEQVKRFSGGKTSYFKYKAKVRKSATSKKMPKAVA